MSKPRQEERDAALPQDKGYANEDDLHPSDRAVLGLEAQDESRDPRDREPGTLADNDDQETIDGLDGLEESVREEAEDRVTGNDRGRGL